MNNPYRVWLVNHGYFMQRQFQTLDEALKATKNVGFEATIYSQRGVLMASWSPLTGTMFY